MEGTGVGVSLVESSLSTSPVEAHEMYLVASSTRRHLGAANCRRNVNPTAPEPFDDDAPALPLAVLAVASPTRADTCTSKHLLKDMVFGVGWAYMYAWPAAAGWRPFPLPSCCVLLLSLLLLPLLLLLYLFCSLLYFPLLLPFSGASVCHR